MKASADLFDLIQSLTKSEKRFFKLFAGLQEGEKNYLRLFDAIDRQEEYDEDELRRELGLKHISFEKNYLYKLILKSLRNFHSDNSVRAQLSDALWGIEILHSKGLYRQCEKKLAKCKKLAIEHEQFHAWQEILRWENTLLFNTLSSPDIVNRSKEIHKEQKEVIDITKNSIEFESLADRVAFMVQVGGATRSDDEAKRFNEFLQHHLLQDESNAMTDRSRKHFYYIHAMVATAMGDTEKGYIYRKKHLDLIESKMDVVKYNLANYIYVLNNFGWACLLVHKTQEALETATKLRNLEKLFPENVTPALQARVFARAGIIELFAYAKKGDFETASSLLPGIEKGLHEFRDKIDKTQLFLLNLAVINAHFGNGETRKALPWLNQILNTSDLELRQDFYCLSKIINLILHYELGNADMIEHLLKSTYRFLSNKHRMYRFEAALLQFIRRELSSPQNPVQLRSAFARLKEALAEILQDPHEKSVLWYFDFVSWLESKIENRPFADVVKEKFIGEGYAA